MQGKSMENYQYLYVIIPLFLFLYIWKFTSQKAKPPGPSGWPFFGNFFQLTNFPHQTMEKWAKKFGDIYRIKLLGKDIVVVNSEELIREVIITNADAFSGRPKSLRIGFYYDGGYGIVGGKVTEKWIKVKKAIMTSIKSYGEGLKRIEELTLDCAQGLTEYADSFHGKPFDPEEIIHLTFAKVIHCLTLGQNMKTEDAKLYAKVERESLEYVTLGGTGTELEIFPILRFLRPSIQEKLKMVGDTERLIVAPAIENCKADDRENWNTIFHSFLKYNENVDVENKLSDHDLATITVEVIGAGISTSSTALYGLLGILIGHPEISKKMQAEIDDVIGSRTPSLDDKIHMPYINAVLMELLRYISHIPTSLPHETTREVELGGYKISKGEEVWLNLWALHHDDRYWEEPYAFRPERFLTPDGDLVPPGHINRRRLMPFGAGRRVCVGENLAKSRLFILVCLLFQRYNILPESDKKPQKQDPRRFNAGLVLEPENYMIRCITRDNRL